MRIQANQITVSRLVATFREEGVTSDGWDTFFLDQSTGQRWRRIYLGAASHGGGMPILIHEPMPTVAELLELVQQSSDSAEIAAGAWLLSEVDPEGGYKDSLIALAERAARQDDPARVALLVGWGNLHDEMNLRPALGRPSAQVISDHEHFKGIAIRAPFIASEEHRSASARSERLWAGILNGSLTSGCSRRPVRLEYGDGG